LGDILEFKIAVLPGDGIGPEVTSEALKILRVIEEIYGLSIKTIELPIGGASLDLYGSPLTDEALSEIKTCDASFLGAVGGEKWDSETGGRRPEAGLLGLRKELGLFANIRPAKLYPALMSACPLRSDIAEKGIDMVVVRELIGGMYFGESGRITTETGEAAYDVERYSRDEVARIAKVAFEMARSRRGRVTSVDKANVLESSRLWRETVCDVSKEYPDISLDHLYVDNASMQLIKDPARFDIVLASNMFGDILSDEAAMITGSIGLLPSASFGEDSFGLYEPVHGSAPDIAGKQLANPLAAILSVALMLRISFGLGEAAGHIEAAVESCLDDGLRTADLAAPGAMRLSTEEMGKAVIQKIKGKP